mgnify:FL=1
MVMLDNAYTLLYIYLVMQTAVFQTLADPSRLQIVVALLGGECAVNDLAARMEIHQSGVSRHLHILEQAGFVQMRPDGARRLYSLRPEPFRELDTWVTRYRALWTARLDAFGDALARKQQARQRTRRSRRTP